MGRIYNNKIKSTNTNHINNINSFSFYNIPDDILLHIATFLNKKDRINFKQINKFVASNYHVFLDISDSIAISCYRNNMKLINYYFEMKEPQKLIFLHIIKNYQMTIFNKLQINNLYQKTYEEIIIQCCKYNYYEIIKRVLDYIQSSEIHIIHVKNVFANQHYQLFQLLYTLPFVYKAPLNSIFAEACALGQIAIVKTMLINPNIDPSHQNNKALNNAVEYKQYNIVKLLIDSNRVNQNIIHNCALRIAIANNNIMMVKLLFTDPRLDISDFNLLNIQNIMKNQEIFEYILNSNNINHIFINKCIYSYLISNNIEKIKDLVNHPKFRKNTLFPHYEYNYILISRVNINDLEILDLLIDITNNNFVYEVLKKLIILYSNDIHNIIFKLLLIFVLNKVNNDDYVMTAIIDIMSPNPNNVTNINSIYNIVSTYKSFFDTVYDLGYFHICKQYIALSSTNITLLFKNFYHGKYNNLAKMFLNYY